MKKKLIAVLLASTFMLSGCAKEEAARKSSMDDATVRVAMKSFETYRGLSMEMEFAWYDDFLKPIYGQISDSGGYVPKDMLNPILDKVDTKLDQLNSIEDKSLDNYFEYIKELKTRNEDKDKPDKEYNKIIVDRKTEAKNGMKIMKDDLTLIKNLLDKGKEKKFTSSDAAEMKALQRKLVLDHDKYFGE